MKVVVTGGTGFIGRPLVSLLLSGGHEVTVLTRRPSAVVPPGARAVVWPAGEEGKSLFPNGDTGPNWREALEGAGAVVNLAGESIASRRWNRRQKDRIVNSRVLGTRMLVDAIAGLKQKPEVLISSSAVGYYGWTGDGEITESAGPGRDFLSSVCVDWEREALRAESADLRVVLLRTGIVLAKDGGSLPRMLLPFRLFAGGPMGSGKQWMPWIHRDDLLSLIVFLMENERARGPVNAVAPEPVRNRDFCRALAGMLRRPCRLWVPGPVLKIILGEMAAPLLLNGQRAVPAKSLELGFDFRYGDLKSALGAILS
ncbi:MAG: TIGR01777 family oxidoreductase [Bacillota bacterium]